MFLKFDKCATKEEVEALVNQLIKRVFKMSLASDILQKVQVGASNLNLLLFQMLGQLRSLFEKILLPLVLVLLAVCSLALQLCKLLERLSLKLLKLKLLVKNY